MFRLRFFAACISLLVPGQSLVAERKDPTRPAAYVSPNQTNIAASKHTLNSILISPGRRLAVVDGHIFKEGDRYNGLLISKIKSDSVLISTRDKTMTLRLGATGEKK